MIHDEKGLTLLEVLISVVILSIIFLSIMRLFPQMGFINNENEDKTKAVNIANQILIEWQQKDNVKLCLKNDNCSTTNTLEYLKSDSSFFYFKTTSGTFNVIIKIKRSTDLTSTPIKTRLIDLQLLNKRNNIVAETYGYIILK